MNFLSFFTHIRRRLRRGRSKAEIDPDEIFLDSTNLPEFDRDQFEGRLEKPLSGRVIASVSIFFVLIGCVFSYRLWHLQIAEGTFFAERSARNSLHQTVIFSDRGIIYDRNKVPLAWNVENASSSDFSLRKYATTTGISNLLGYVKYPSKDTSGFYYRADYEGVDGVEKHFDTELQGTHGIKITETDVYGAIASQGVLDPPESGDNLVLSIDSRIQSKLYDVIDSLSRQVGFTGGAGVMMDIRTGEIISYVTYPEYDSQTFTDGVNSQRIKQYLNDPANPLLDRVSSGLYTPGSIVKPFIAMAALSENVISPTKVLYTTGSISIPNPYNPELPTVFRDWKDQGAVDMRKALEQSSDVYFYEIGGGYGDQKGLGILNIKKYMELFGFGQVIGPSFFGTKKGVIPDPEWKAANFDGEPWRVGNTYHTSIGQYGFQITLMQMVRAIGAIGNRGTLLEPTIIANDTTAQTRSKKLPFQNSYYDVIHEGMHRATERGTAVAVNIPGINIAAKTGTAELGVSKNFVNSSIEGFFPYENPKYAFVILMEKGPRTNLIGAPYVARQLFDWMAQHTPEYFE